MRALYFAASSGEKVGSFVVYVKRKIIVGMKVEMKIVCQILGKSLHNFDGGYTTFHLSNSFNPTLKKSANQEHQQFSRM
mgnify:CR=1 FL=1